MVGVRGNFDYASEGAYFITLVTHHRVYIFGKVINDKVELTKYGAIAHHEWISSAALRKEVEIFEDELVVMPNHLHGIIWINKPVSLPAMNQIKNNLGVGATGRLPQRDEQIRVTGPTPKSVSAFIAGYKSAVTTEINKLRNSPKRLVWQPNYFDRIIRNERELNALRQYIQNNPLKWKLDNHYID
jgi:REP element-mobilizing transposase RayT